MRRRRILPILLPLSLLLACEDAAGPAAASSPKPPAGVSDLVVWLDASAIKASTAGDSLREWANLADDAYPARAPDNAHRPVLSLDAESRTGVTFRTDCGRNDPLNFCDYAFMQIFGVGDRFDGAGATVFVVATLQDDGYALYSSGEPTDTVYCGGVTCDQWWRFPDDGSGYVGVFHHTRVAGYPSSMPATGIHTIAMRSGEQYEVFLDGLGQGAQPGSFDTGSDHYIAWSEPGSDQSTQSRRFFNGTIHEVLAYRRALSDAEIGALFGYLTRKWGAPSSLTLFAPRNRFQEAEMFDRHPVPVEAAGTLPR